MQDFLAGNVALQKTLAILEIERKKVAKAQTKGITYIGVGIGILIVGLLLGLFLGGVIAGLIPMIYGIVILTKISVVQKAYEHAYKQNVIGEALKFLDPNLTIDFKGGISEEEFRHAKLFTKQIDSYRTEDLVSGKIDKTSFYFAEVHAEHKTERETKDGTKTTWTDVFKGIVFVADFNKNLSDITIVKPRDLLNTIDSWFSKNIFSFDEQQVVRLENPDFERTFVTFGSNQIESRYVLTPAMMERILYLNSNALESISLSFIASRMYIAFPLDRNYFEAPIFESLLHPVSLNTDINTIRFLCDIVNELSLNTRIWGKE